jgi:hypothetical protein
MLYSLEQVVKIEKSRKYSFRLDEETIERFKVLVNEIGNPIQKKPSHMSHATSSINSSSESRKVGGGGGGKDSQWETVRRSKAQQSSAKPSSNSVQMKTPKSKMVPDELVRKDDKAILTENIDEIRILLNKMTAKSYPETLDAMVRRLQAFQRYHRNGLLDETILAKISETIFTIATQNRFYSKLYADLFSELVSQFDFLSSMFNTYAANVIDKFLDVAEPVSEENYEMFCKLNESNDQRKSLAEFFVNLNKTSIISDETLQMYCVTVLKTVMTFVKQEDKKYQVDVLVDVLSILYDKVKMNQVKFLFLEEEELDVNKCIKRFSKAKTTEFLSLTKKSIFKFMDMQGL